MYRSRDQIVITTIVAVLCAATVTLGVPAPISAVLGLTLVLIPGLVWTEVLLGPGGVTLERLAVAGALSLAAPVPGGFLLYLAGVPLHRASWAALFAAVTLAGSAVLLARRPPRTRPAPAAPPRRLRRPVRPAIAISSAAVIGAAAVALAVAGAAAQSYPGFTQLSLVRDGTSSYLMVGNHQDGIVRYRLVLYRGGLVGARWDISLGNGQTWQTTIRSGGTVLAADLYRWPDLAHPYRYVTTNVDSAPSP